VAETGPRFCPRCGTARVGEMAFCPNCGLDLHDLPRDAGVVPAPAADTPADTAAATPADSASLPASPGPPPLVAPVPQLATRAGDEERRRGPSAWGSILPAIILIAILGLIAAWLGGIGPFARGSDGSSGPGVLPVATPSPTSAFAPVTAAPSFSVGPGLTAPPVGLTILSPADRAVVGSQDLTVIGSAPAGLTITQDISFGLDRHATVDGTGHWAISVQLSDGENKLTFRIGDDHSTSQTIRVIYIPPAS
jgi:hypothetical protein